MAFEFISKALAERKQHQLYRAPATFESGTGRYLSSAGERYLNFASNDYLGFAVHPAVVSAWQQGAQQYGVGSGASFLITGTHSLHQQLIDTICAFTGYDDALLFSSGAAANHGILTALMNKGDLLLQDKLNHASLLDGGLASGATMRRFLHNDPVSLAKHLAKPANNKLVVTEGVFSMDGDSAPLADIAQACTDADAWLMVDDAHSLGVVGETGLGSLAPSADSREPIRPQLYMATCGKALGVGGAFVAGSKATIDYLRQFSRQYIYTTAMPPAQAAAIQAALELLQQEPAHIQALHRNISFFKELATEASLPVLDSTSAIQPIMIGDAARTMAIAQALAAQGCWVGAIRSPTVAPNAARLRVTLSAAHSLDDISYLVKAIAHAVQQ